MANTGENLWKFKLDGEEEYNLHAKDLTVGVLRQLKAWYGPSYGSYLGFIQMLMQGDCDAVACALWIVQRAAGKKPKEPRFMDFSVSDFFIQEEEPEAAEGEDEDGDEEANPQEGDEATPDSTPTSPNSEPGTSST